MKLRDCQKIPFRRARHALAVWLVEVLCGPDMFWDDEDSSEGSEEDISNIFDPYWQNKTKPGDQVEATVMRALALPTRTIRATATGPHSDDFTIAEVENV